MEQQGRLSYLNRFLIVFSILFLGIASQSFAQFKIYGVAEKGKIKKHGNVITYEPKKSVIMECQGDTLTFDLNEYSFRFTTRKPAKPYIFPDGRNYHRISLGVLVGQPGDGGYINYSYHHQKNQFIGYGGSAAFENYGDEDGYDFIVPSAVFYSYFQKKNVSPFARLSAGYGIAIKNTSKFQTKAQGGINLGAAVGMRLSTNRIMIDFTAGARFQKANYEFDFGEFTKETDAFFRRLDFSIGFMW